MKGKIGLKLLIGLALLTGALFLGRYAQRVFANDWYKVICHHTPARDVTLRFRNAKAYRNHLGTPHNKRVYDTDGACEKPTPTPTPIPEPDVTIDRPTLECGTNYVKFTGHRDPTKNTYVKFIINGRYPEVFYGNGDWWTGELTLAPKDYKIRAELWGRALCEVKHECKDRLLDSQDGRFTIDECEPEVTPTPTPTETPKPPENPITEAGAPICQATSPINPVSNPLVWRLGGTAIVQWQPQASANKANIYYHEVQNPENKHAVRDVDNTGYVEINELGGLDWTFGVQESQDCAGGQITWIMDGSTADWVLFRP